MRVTTNNDIAYIWWSVSEKIPGCLGFSIHRQIEHKAPVVLPAWVGFDRGPKTTRPRDTDVWPVQSFQWKDVYAPRDKRFRYRIYAVGGTPAAPTRDTKPILVTPYVALEEQIGKLRIVFNRGLIATQAMNKGSDAPAAKADALRKAISSKGNKIRRRLAKELLPTLTELHRRSQQSGGVCYSALYELTDEELIQLLMDTPGAEVVLSNADSSKQVSGRTVEVPDGTNDDGRRRLRDDPDLDLTDRMLKGNSIGHNKFVVYEDPDRKLTTVLTGSTNWTATGICGQTNNAVLIEDPDLASHYHAYWKKIRDEQTDLQGPELRTWARENPRQVSLGKQKGTLKVWFSPNTTRKTKSDKEVPVDLAEVFDIIEKARKAVLFLLFNPGKPSIIEKIREVAAARSEAGELLYVRGAISDPQTAKEGAVKLFNRSAKRADTIITGVAGVPDDFGYWEKELLKLGHAVIHDKVLVVDPFSADSAVVTGSHNLGYKASFANDENMIIIRRNRKIAEAFATHVLDVVNHYRWRYKLQDLHREGRMNEAWQDLEDGDTWQDKYFDGGFLASRDKFILR
ncbi:MAG: phospholipase D-like domain-containing protein [Gemmatimonadaceae bacterium]